jgi:hypothetical protein
MSSKSAYFENKMLLLTFNAVGIDGLAENDSSSPVTDLVVALHTADPGEGGNQSTNEIVYTGYVRKLVPRTAAGWTVSGSNAWPVNPIEFGEMTGGAGGVVTHASVGDGISDHILYRGPVTSNITVVNGVIPRLKTAVGPTATKITES